MKYYIRTTHNFNNETREWEYRNLPEWNGKESDFPIIHVINFHHWESEKFILKEDRGWTINDLGSVPENYKDKQLKELEELVKLDMIRVKENP